MAEYEVQTRGRQLNMLHINSEISHVVVSQEEKCGYIVCKCNLPDLVANEIENAGHNAMANLLRSYKSYIEDFSYLMDSGIDMMYDPSNDMIFAKSIGMKNELIKLGNHIIRTTGNNDRINKIATEWSKYLKNLKAKQKGIPNEFFVKTIKQDTMRGTEAEFEVGILRPAYLMNQVYGTPYIQCPDEYQPEQLPLGQKMLFNSQRLTEELFDDTFKIFSEEYASILEIMYDRPTVDLQ